jgi:hypothetical protein
VRLQQRNLTQALRAYAHGLAHEAGRGHTH